MKKLFSFFILLITFSHVTYSQQNNIFSINTVPYGSIPLGSSAEVFNLGAGIEASAFFIPSALRFVGPQIGANFSMLPLESADAIWTIAGFAGPLVRIPLGDRFALLGHGGFGYYYWNSAGWDAGGTNGGGLMISAGAKGTFRIAGPFTLGVGVAYDYYANLYNGLRFELVARFIFSSAVQPKPAVKKSAAEVKPEPLNETGKGVEIRDVKLFPLFPVLYKYYDNNPVGTIRVKNFGTVPAENIKINFFVERYMDNPMDSGESFSLGPGEEKAVELFGLFTEDVMEITEGTKASARVTLSCDQSAEAFTADYNPVIEFHNRNALSWDDDRKIASFITAKDPEILGFAKNVMTWMQDIKYTAIDENLQKGMAIYEAVRSYGIRYQIDPATPFSELSEQREAVDFLQFPRQTLEYSNGDCDDLSALYTALMEAAGVESAVITIPGHIFAAFALKSSPEEARRVFSKPDNLAFINEKAWVPVEITMFQEPFEKAWSAGAKEWRENRSREQAELYPTRDSWKIYQAVGYLGGGAGAGLPDREKTTKAFTQSLERHVEQEIFLQVAEIQALMQQGKDDYKYKNKLAVLYANYGLYDRALEGFKQIVAQREYVPALINIGNIHFLRKEFDSAIAFYDRVLSTDAKNKAALLGSARCNHELENYGLVSRIYGQLKSIDPNLAMRFAYLDLRGEEGTRAADAVGLREIVLWEEE
ncbi:MAG: hypothetical protein E4H36_08675 [Spirochaetales bacterium]|nr:MAG: hypothetical protein E4H36_08675 [Spirochaetales bacterium]